MSVRGRQIATVLVSIAVATAIAGCGRTFELGGLRVGPSLPGRGLESSPADRTGEDLVAAREAALERLIQKLSDGAHGPTGDVVLRLSLTGGWEIPGNDLHLSVEDDGRVVRVTDTSVFSSTHDYSSLLLSPTGVIRLLDAVRPLLATRPSDVDGGAGVSPTDRSAWLEVGPDIVLSMDRLGQTEGYGPDQQAQRQVFEDVIDAIRDPSWLGEDVVVPESPWIPETMTVLATPGPGPSGDGTRSVPWPLDSSINALATGTEVDPSGAERLVLCLTGADVAPVFSLLTGVNHAHLAVDDGQAWDLDIRAHYPGYRLLSDPCP